MECRECEMAGKLSESLRGQHPNLAMSWMSTVTPKDTRLNIREKVLQFEHDFTDMCREHPKAFKEVLTESPPLKHSFVDGVYVREITLPAHSIIIGRIHRHEHFNFITKGRVRCVTESKGVEEIVGPCSMVSEAGTKRVLYVYEETIWTTVHRTDATTVEDAEKEVIAESYSAMGLPDPVVINRELEG